MTSHSVVMNPWNVMNMPVGSECEDDSLIRYCAL